MKNALIKLLSPSFLERLREIAHLIAVSHSHDKKTYVKGSMVNIKQERWQRIYLKLNDLYLYRIQIATLK